jgi:hypothetical protein
MEKEEKKEGLHDNGQLKGIFVRFWCSYQNPNLEVENNALGFSMAHMKYIMMM